MPLKRGKWELIVWWDEPIPPLEKVTLPRAPQCVPGLHVSFTDNVLSSPQRTHNAPAHDPNLAQTAPQPPGGEKLYVPPAVKREEITETFLTLRNEGNSRRGGSGHKYVDWCCKTATNQLPTEVHQPPQPQLSRCC